MATRQDEAAKRFTQVATEIGLLLERIKGWRNEYADNALHSARGIYWSDVATLAHVRAKLLTIVVGNELESEDDEDVVMEAIVKEIRSGR